MNTDFLSAYQLLDRYDLSKQRVYINGVQTFLRMAIAQRQIDQQAGIDSGGLITGYRGSPVGGLDLEAWRETELLQQHDVVFQPSINEDLAAALIDRVDDVRGFGVVKQQRLCGYYKNIDEELKRYLTT